MADVTAGATPSRPHARRGRWRGYHFYNVRAYFDAPTQANPLFRRDVRRVAWWHRPVLQARLLLWQVVLVLALWGSVVAGGYYAWLGSIQAGSDANILSVYVLMFTGALAVLGSTVLDVRVMLMGVGSVVEERVAGRWDLVRVTGLPAQDMVTGKVAATVAQAWPLVLRLIGLRLGVLLGAALTMFVGGPLLLGAAFYPRLRGAVLYGGWDVWSWMLLFAGLTLMVLLEPAWHARAAATMSVAVSARARRGLYALLVGWGLVLLQWAIQVAAMWAALAWLIGVSYGPSGGTNVTWWVVFYAAGVPLLVWGFYRVVRGLAWASAVGSIAAPLEPRR